MYQNLVENTVRDEVRDVQPVQQQHAKHNFNYYYY